MSDSSDDSKPEQTAEQKAALAKAMRRKIDRFVGNRLRQARESAGVGRNELARVMGLGENAKNPGHQIYLIESGTQGMSLLRIWEFCEVLGIRPADLLDDTVEFAPPKKVE